MNNSGTVILAMMLAAISSMAHAQFQPVSTFLTDPQFSIDYVKTTADLYLNSKDTEGYFAFCYANGFPREDQRIPGETYQANSFFIQSRLAYSFVKTFMLTGDTTYLYDARHALKYFYDKGWDEENDGWYFIYNRDNNTSFGVWWAPEWKWTFNQQYAMVGIAAMVEATGGRKNWYDISQLSDQDWFDRGIHNLYDHLWDDDADNYGYYDFATRDYSEKWDKGFGGTVDGLTTNALVSALFFEDSKYKERLRQMTDNCVEHFVANMDHPDVKIGFPGEYDTDWNIDYSRQVFEVGHMLKAAWCLGRSALILNDNSYFTEGRKIIDQVLDQNHPTGIELYDYTFGGPHYSGNWFTGELIDRSKYFWAFEQAILSGLIFGYISEEEDARDTYVRMADESAQFFEEHFIDESTGITYATLSRDGETVIDSSKNDVWDGAYHYIEMAYYIHLYTRLYYNNDSISLYYLFDPGEYAESRKLTPVPTKNDQLIISSVKLNGQPFLDFDAASRTLHIQEKQGGVFQVNYKISENMIGISRPDPALPEMTIYPNPASDYFRIHLANVLPYSSIKLFDLNGKVLLESMLPGDDPCFNIAGIPPGIYMVRVTTGNYIISKKLIIQ